MHTAETWIPIFGITYFPDNWDLNVTDFSSNTVSVFDSTTNTDIDTIGVTNVPIELAYNPDNGNRYVTNPDDDTISVKEVNLQAISDIIKGIIKNPLDIANSIESAHQKKYTDRQQSKQ